MHPIPAISRCFAAGLAGLLVTAVLGCGPRNTWVNPDHGQFLVEKVKVNRNAYLRYAQAEEESRRDGNAADSARYQEAKEAARKEYDRYSRELSAYNAAHPGKAVTEDAL
ncbi:hypothetical protein DFW101_1894 [Solidesulfovibrio carbinoliphilus subsp. oakridgensis]|uniref:Uncharacterized protein n=1 Tax=Solidesulfovibrio carbinoliphilus subsp. oakridgensis TaxID=694327 RepID=G7Q4X3_9BACT|nr:hypothetical protein [Solidesulfovibrio carbinoliphilus]EHJ47900.1 hypothetical protein DFW101_1894 [Solidesulfovibrio carbinoliphilus subsp. oakridgensis]